MAAISPTLKIGLGLAVGAAVVSVVMNSGGDEPIIGDVFDSPLALIDDAASTATWEAPPVTRNPFASGQLSVDDDAVEELVTEVTTVPDSAAAGAATSTTATIGSVRTTETTLTFEETVSRRVPAGAPAVTTTTVPSGGGIQIDG